MNHPNRRIDIAAMNGYLSKLLSATPEGQLARADLQPHEVRLLERLRQHETEVQRAEERLGQLQNEIQGCEVAIVTARGRGNGIAEALWAEYLELRVPKAEAKPNGEAKPAAKDAPAPTA